LQQISLKTLKLFRQIILVVSRVGGHRDECLILEDIGFQTRWSADVENAVKARKIVRDYPYFLLPEKFSQPGRMVNNLYYTNI
jgi:hypothetical protein